MTMRLGSEGLTLDIDPPRGMWVLRSKRSESPVLSSVLPTVIWKRRDGKGRQTALTGDAVEGIDVRGQDEGASRLSLRVSTREGLDIAASWQLRSDSPMALWRTEISNVSDGAIEIERIMLCQGHVLWQGPRGACGSVDLGLFTNGWQSWNYTGALSRLDAFPRTRLGPLTSPMRVNPGTPQPRGRGRYASDMFAVLACRVRRTGILLGFLSQSQAFGSLDCDLRTEPPNLRAWANCDNVALLPGATFATDWLAAQIVDLDAIDPLAPYLDAVAQQNNARVVPATPTGWCSWYYFFDHVREADVLANLEWLRDRRDELPLDVVQIDDGYEADVGDWDQTKPSFPSGMATLASRIRTEGFRPGIWLAPFILRPSASLARAHPEWLLRHPSGRPVNAGYVWDTFARALDVTHPQVVEWACCLVRTAVHEWGFDYLKLDFLYAGALAGRRNDRGQTRAQALRRALEALRREAGDGVTLVGCGCPLGSGVGIFDVMRIGPDVAPRWHPSYRGIERFFRGEPDFPSARNAIRNTITRAMLHRRWWINDPDCLLLRRPASSPQPAQGKLPGEESTPSPTPRSISAGVLTDAELQTLATAVALSAGSLIISEHLPSLDEERCSWLARLLPPLPEAARSIDWMDAASPSVLILPLEGPVGSWHLVAVLNWEEKPREMSVPFSRLGLSPATCHLVDFWRGEYAGTAEGELRVGSIPAHGVRLLAVRPELPGPQWLGDTLHVSQGLSVSQWQAGSSVLRAVLNIPRIGFGRVWLSLPDHPITLTCNGNRLAAAPIGGSVFAIEITVPRRAELEITWA